MQIIIGPPPTDANEAPLRLWLEKTAGGVVLRAQRHDNLEWSLLEFFRDGTVRKHYERPNYLGLALDPDGALKLS